MACHAASGCSPQNMQDRNQGLQTPFTSKKHAEHMVESRMNEYSQIINAREGVAGVYFW